MKTIIITHRDLDGIVSAVSYAWNLLEKENKPKTINKLHSLVDIVSYQHYEDIYQILRENNIDINNYKSLVILDCAVSIKDMKKFRQIFKDNFIWIDHHKIKKLEVESKIKGINGIRDSNYCASTLVWKFFKKGTPEFVKYVEDIDLWKLKLPKIHKFFAGLREIQGKFTKEDIRYIFRLLDYDYFIKEKKKVIKKGEIIEQHQRDHVKKIADLGKIVNFKGYKSFIINTIYHPSLVSQYLLENEKFKDIEIFIVWYREQNSRQYKVSLRSETKRIDLAKIAKKYNGGGHYGAAGFNVDDIEKLNIKEWKK